MVRRLTGPDGLVAYETVDVAKLEGEGATAKVVTASDPFSGYVQSVQGYSLNGLDIGGGVSGQLTSYAILIWAFDAALPGKPLGGTITGKVVRTVWRPGATVPDYEPVGGAVVSGVDTHGNALLAMYREDADGPYVAISRPDGTYALLDFVYNGGSVRVAALVDGEIRFATAYEAKPQDLKGAGLQFVRHVAVADIAFPEARPTIPAGLVQVHLLRQHGTSREPAGSVVEAGQPLLIGVRAGEAQVRAATIRGEEYAVRIDPLHGEDPLGMDAVIDYLPTAPGTYTVTIYATTSDGAPVTGGLTFRAVAAGGTGQEVVQDAAPAVLTASIVPEPGARGVSVHVFPTLAVGPQWELAGLFETHLCLAGGRSRGGHRIARRGRTSSAA